MIDDGTSLDLLINSDVTNGCCRHGDTLRLLKFDSSSSNKSDLISYAHKVARVLVAVCERLF